MSDSLPRILIVEDDDPIRTLLVAALRHEAFEVDSANDGAAALLLTQATEYAVIVLDLMMPRLDGYGFLEAFRKTAPDARSVVFVITAFDEPQFGKLKATRVHAVIRKPFDVPQLVTMIREVALLWRVQTESANADADSPQASVVLPEPDDHAQRPN